MSLSTGARQVVIGGMLLESNSFSPFVADLDDFRHGIYFVEGEEILRRFAQKKSEIRGFLDGIGDGGGRLCQRWPARRSHPVR